MSTVMPTLDTTKKPALKDWHRADIKAALEKRGWSIRSLSASRGYARKSLASVLSKPWPAAERYVADVIGVPPQRIWPSRYHRDGTPKSGRGERGIGRALKRSTAPAGRNTNSTGVR